MRIPLGALACALVLAGCVLSLDEVVPASQATFDPRLLGAWESEGHERAVLTRDGDAYAVAYTDDKGKTGRFHARLGRLGPRAVLDAWPESDGNGLDGPAGGTFIPGHILLALDVASDSIVAQALEPDTVEAALRAGRMRLTFSKIEDNVVLQGTTVQLRAALTPWVARSRTWAEPGTWHRATSLSASTPVDPPCFEAASWREADALFHRDPHWVGGDGASSVDLGGGRILWLFGDSWVDSTGRATRPGARMVSNTVAIQRGADPSSATFTAYWGRTAEGGPGAFIPDSGAEHHWFGHGVRVGDRLVLFLSRTLTGTGPGVMGFTTLGWMAVLVENPDDEPSAWRWRRLRTPANRFGVLLGSTSAARFGDWVYGFGSLDPAPGHPTYAARWRTADVVRGDLLAPEWWAGPARGWVPDSAEATRLPLLQEGAPDETFHFDSVSGRFLEFEAVGFPAADVDVRAAPRLTGPWSPPRLLYRPPEYYRPNGMTYAAKAHPELAGADLVVTYTTNTFKAEEQLTDSTVYWPHFVRLTRCR